MLFRQIFDETLSQYAYLIGCQHTGEALLIDPERDIDRYLEIARREGLRITTVTETHIHADFLSGSRELVEHDDTVVAYLSGDGDDDWQYEWTDHPRARRLHDGDSFSVGRIEIQAVHTPGHTPEHLSFLVTDRGGGASAPMGIASGDFVFVGALGRPDLLETAAGISGAMEPAARRLYQAARSFLELPDHLQVWPGHGAGSACGKGLGAVPVSTVGYERRLNAQLVAATGDEEAFVAEILDGQPEPPLYFARMKHENKAGPAILGELPRPRHLTAQGLESLLDGDDTIVLDGRVNRDDYKAGHLRGSLYAPLDASFVTIAGSYLEPGHAVILLVDARADVEPAVRGLVRIGLDRVTGYFLADDLPALAETGAWLAATTTIDFAELRARLASGDEPFVLDVRGASELAAGSIDGALNVAHTRLAAHLDELPADRDIAIYCRTGARATAAAALLERRGLRPVLVDDLFTRW